MTIFGISIGTTRTGICIMKDRVLMRAEVHNYFTRWSDEKLTKMVIQYREYVEKYNVRGIVVKVPRMANHSPKIKIIMDEIALLAREYNCEFDFITRGELKSATDTASTEEMIVRAVRLYPELKGLYERGKGSYPHFQRLYEAVLAARIFEEKTRMRE